MDRESIELDVLKSIIVKERESVVGKLASTCATDDDWEAGYYEGWLDCMNWMYDFLMLKGLRDYYKNNHHLE